MKRKIALLWAFCVLSQIFTASSVYALQWPSPSPAVTTGYGWRIHPTEGGPNWHNGIDIRPNGSSKLKAVESGNISYVVLKTQDLEGGQIRNRTQGINRSGNRVFFGRWEYLHLSDSVPPEWEFATAKGWDEESQTYSKVVNYFAIQIENNTIYYCTNPKIELQSGSRKDALTSVTE